MTWYKVDDGIHSHPKFLDVSLAAVGLWTMCGAWCSAYLTDGQITRRQVQRLGGDDTLAAELVDAGLKGLRGELHDDANGGWYPTVTSTGDYTPDKQAYAHAFVLLAASSATLIGRPGAQELLDDAEEIFLKYFWDAHEGLSVDTWNTKFTFLDSYRGLNANMHSVEAFLAVADVTGDEA